MGDEVDAGFSRFPLHARWPSRPTLWPVWDVWGGIGTNVRSGLVWAGVWLWAGGRFHPSGGGGRGFVGAGGGWGRAG